MVNVVESLHLLMNITLRCHSKNSSSIVGLGAVSTHPMVDAGMDSLYVPDESPEGLLIKGPVSITLDGIT